jgi:predicted acylesterase/phospholipase RssA
MAIPGYFFPVRDWNGREHGYMDGGIVEKTPLLSVIEAHVRAGRGAKLFVLCTHFDSEARLQPPKGCVKRMLHTLERAEEKAWEYQLAQARQVPGCTFAVLNPRMEHGGMFDFEMLRPNYLWARRVFKKRMSNPEFPLLLFAR